MRGFAFGLGLSVCLLGLATTGRAQDAEEEESEEAPRSAIERARAHMERGQALYLQARFEEAAAEFEAAYEAQPFSAFLYNAGVAYERAGRAEQAASFFEQYLERDPDASDRADVTARVRRLRAAAQAAANPPENPSGENPTGENPTGENPTGENPSGENPAGPGPSGENEDTPSGPAPEETADEFKSLLSVRTNPQGATITVRSGETDVATGPAPFAYTLDQGAYSVSVSHPDYQTVTQDVRVEPGRVYVVIVEMSQGEFLGYIRVVSNVPGAQVFIDDREQGPRGQTPFEAPIAVGQHHIWLERPGYRVEETDAEVNIGEDVTVRMDLTRVDYGRIRVVANRRDARVIVDGSVVGNVPYEGQVSAGPHRLRVEADGMKAFETDLTIRNGQLTPVRARLRPDVGRGGAYVTTAFAALFLGAGITLAVLGNETFNSLSAARDEGTLASDDPQFDLGMGMYIAADISFGLSVILGGLALYYFLYDPLPPSEGQVRESRDWSLLPIVDPRGTGGLGVSARF